MKRAGVEVNAGAPPATRQELLAFATWLLKDEFGEGREEQIVDRYLAERAAAGASR